MNYKEMEFDALSGGKEKHIIIDNGDGSFRTFPVDLENPEYVKFLEALENPEQDEATTK
jgi:hypothetical protein